MVPPPPPTPSSPPPQTPSPPAQTPTICCLQLICLSSESADGGYVMWFTKALTKSSQNGLWEENSWIAMGLKCICIDGELETLLTTDSFSADSEDTWYMLSGFVRKKQLGCIWLRTSCCLSNRKDKHNLNFEDKKCCSRTQHSSCEQAIKRSCKCFEMLGRAFFGSNGGEGWQTPGIVKGNNPLKISHLVWFKWRSQWRGILKDFPQSRCILISHWSREK